MKQYITFGVDTAIIDLSPERIETLHAKAEEWKRTIEKYKIKINKRRDK